MQTTINNAPDHLKEYIIPVANIDTIGYFRQHAAWAGALMWKAQLGYGNNTKFRIYYSGQKEADGFITTVASAPLIVWAQPVNSTGRIVLFDERIHGFSALLVEKRTFSDPLSQKYTINDPGDVFEVYLWTNTSIDFEDEFEVGADGKTALLDGSRKSLDYLKRNAYDYTGILLKSSGGTCIRIIDMELA
ncbi:hypothetical protein [Niabella beijingensis]|uniref:hypothetical protein n=1 Tax=Niabella beijingensis TaxID=2872700 RepID=UPI001CBD6D3F|nr:hypothetical protein [Niabella beijingensis]MBZ4192177.1 hypothetical protein [Niabella beijingensis]